MLTWLCAWGLVVGDGRGLDRGRPRLVAGSAANETGLKRFVPTEWRDVDYLGCRRDNTEQI